MGIINKCYYTTHKYRCIHVCEGTQAGLCECLCAWLCFCTCVGAYIYLFMILFMKWNTKFSFWITWYITLIMIFILGYADQPSQHFIRQCAVIKRMREMTILKHPSCIPIFAGVGIASWDYWTLIIVKVFSIYKILMNLRIFFLFL